MRVPDAHVGVFRQGSMHTPSPRVAGILQAALLQPGQAEMLQTDAITLSHSTCLVSVRIP